MKRIEEHIEVNCPVSAAYNDSLRARLPIDSRHIAKSPSRSNRRSQGMSETQTSTIRRHGSKVALTAFLAFATGALMTGCDPSPGPDDTRPADTAPRDTAPVDERRDPPPARPRDQQQEQFRDDRQRDRFQDDPQRDQFDQQQQQPMEDRPVERDPFQDEPS